MRQGEGVCFKPEEKLGWPMNTTETEDEYTILERRYYPGEHVFNMDYGDALMNNKEQLDIIERHQSRGCSSDPMTKKKFDERYRKAGILISELDLQKNSGVLAELAKLTHVELFYGNDNFAKKKDYPYKLFTRESLFFSRRCELYHGISRQYTYELMRNVRESLHELS